MKNIEKIKLFIVVIIFVAISVIAFWYFENKPIILNEPEKVVSNFYNWYLKDIYLKKDVESPDIILKNNIYQIDPSNHIKFLKDSGYFSDLLYKNELPMYEKCDKKLKEVKVEDVKREGDFPPDHVDGNDCSFLSYFIWTGGQGETFDDKIKILNSTIDTNKAEVLVVIKSYGKDYSYPQVTLLKENGKWKISDISVSFDKPEKNQNFN
jgi:hypothetical protein